MANPVPARFVKLPSGNVINVNEITAIYPKHPTGVTGYVGEISFGGLSIFYLTEEDAQALLRYLNPDVAQ